MRRKTETSIPIIRTDKDIPNIMNGSYPQFKNVFDYFVTYNSDLHYFRAVEPSLKIKFHQEKQCDNDESSIMRFGSKVQLASILLEYNSTVNSIASAKPLS